MKTAEEFINDGLEKHKEGNFLDSIAKFSCAIDVDPKNAKAYNLLGYSKNKIGSYFYAIQDFDKALHIDDTFIEAYLNKAFVKQKLGLHQLAIDTYSIALEKNKNKASPYSVFKSEDKMLMASAYVGRGISKEKLDVFSGSIEDHTEAIQLSPNYDEPYLFRGISKGKKGEHQGAILDFTKALEINPTYKSAYFFRSNSKKDLNDFSGALEDLSKLIELEPTRSDFYSFRAHTKSQLEDFVGAISDLEKATELQSIYLYSLAAARLKEQLGDHEGATECYAQGIKSNVQSRMSYSSRGYLKSHIGNHLGDIEDNERTIGIERQYSKSMYNIASTDFDVEDFKNAVKCYNKVLESDPNHVPIYFHRGLAKYYLNQPEEAIIDFEKAVELGDEESAEFLKDHA